MHAVFFMTRTHDWEYDGEACRPLGRGHDQALNFRWRSQQSAVARLQLPPCHNHRYDDARNAVLTEAVLAAEAGRWVSYSRRPAFYSCRRRYRGPSFTRRCILEAIDDSVSAGLLEEDRASPGARGWQSRIRATPFLCGKLGAHEAEFQRQEPICLKDDCGNPLPYNDSDLTRLLRNEIEEINDAIGTIKIEYAGGQARKIGRHWLIGGSLVLPTPPYLYRVFNRASFDCGGRAYGWWQGVKSHYRAAMTLDAEAVAEPDYVALHAQIIYAQRGLALDGDAYETAEFPRNYGKRAFNIALNARSKKAAIGAIIDKLRLDRTAASKLLEVIVRKHRRIADVFNSDLGIRLMRIDSEITINAVKRCLSCGIAVLPVHDSLIVPARYADHVAEIMARAFAAKFPEAPECSVRRGAKIVSTDGGENAPLCRAA